MAVRVGVWREALKVTPSIGGLLIGLLNSLASATVVLQCLSHTHSHGRVRVHKLSSSGPGLELGRSLFRVKNPLLAARSGTGESVGYAIPTSLGSTGSRCCCILPRR